MLIRNRFIFIFVENRLNLVAIENSLISISTENRIISNFDRKSIDLKRGQESNNFDINKKIAFFLLTFISMENRLIWLVFERKSITFEYDRKSAKFDFGVKLINYRI